MTIRTTFPADRIIAIEFLEPFDDSVALFKQAHEVIKIHVERQGGRMVAIWDVEHTPVEFGEIGQREPLIFFTLPKENRTHVDHIVVNRDDVRKLLWRCKSVLAAPSYDDAVAQAQWLLGQ